MTDLIFKTSDLNEMKNYVIKALRERYLNYRYAAAGIRELDPHDFLEGAWIEVIVDGVKVQSIDYYNVDELN